MGKWDMGVQRSFCDLLTPANHRAVGGMCTGPDDVSYTDSNVQMLIFDVP